MLSDHSDGQLPFAVITPRVRNTDAVITDCQSWIAQNYACQNPVASMIAHSSLKPGTFARRFLAATGLHPVDYVHAVRMEEAKRRLETESGSLEDIGHLVGYEDPTFFRRLFKRKVGLTLAAYRRKFSKIAAIGPLAPPQPLQRKQPSGPSGNLLTAPEAARYRHPRVGWHGHDCWVRTSVGGGVVATGRNRRPSAAWSS
jgi:AraC-like DNA-binding protein